MAVTLKEKRRVGDKAGEVDRNPILKLLNQFSGLLLDVNK